MQERLLAEADVIEAIDFLKVQPALEKLTWNEGIARACRDHAYDMGTNHFFAHASSDGSNFSTRMKRYGTIEGVAGENIAAGFGSGRSCVIALVIDAGIPSRGHRNNIFNGNYKLLGVGTGVYGKSANSHC